MAKHWYSYIGPPNPSLFLATWNASYFFTSLNGRYISAACQNGPKPCAIYVTGAVNSAPDGPLSFNIQQYIADALITNTSQPTLPFGVKRYVYMKPDF